MKNQQTAFFLEIQEIPENSPIFDELQKEELFFSYFQVDQNYYLFFYGQKSIDLDLIDPLIEILEELDRKQRKIRVNGVNRLFPLCFRNYGEWKRS